MYFSSRPRSSSNSWFANSSGILSSQCAVAFHSYGTQDQALAFLAHVVADVRVAQQGQACIAALDQGRNVFGDQVLVRQRDDGQVLADHRCDFTAAVAGRIDDGLGLDRALVRVYPPFAGRQAFDRGDLGPAVDLRARVASALGQRLRELRRVDVAVVGIVEAGEDVGRVDERVTLDDLGRAQHLELDALGVGLRDDVPELVHAIARVRKAHAAGDVVVDVVADLLRQRRVQLGAVTLQLDHVPRRREVGAVACRVPGGAGREFVAFEQHDVREPELRQVVEGAATDGTAADHDYPGMRLHALLNS